VRNAVVIVGLGMKENPRKRLFLVFSLGEYLYQGGLDVNIEKLIEDPPFVSLVDKEAGRGPSSLFAICGQETACHSRSDIEMHIRCRLVSQTFGI